MMKLLHQVSNLKIGDKVIGVNAHYLAEIVTIIFLNTDYITIDG